MDEQSGETEEEEVISEVIGESEVKELVPELGWRRDKGVGCPRVTQKSSAKSLKEAQTCTVSSELFGFWFFPLIFRFWAVR